MHVNFPHVMILRACLHIHHMHVKPAHELSTVCDSMLLTSSMVIYTLIARMLQATFHVKITSTGRLMQTKPLMSRYKSHGYQPQCSCYNISPAGQLAMAGCITLSE